MKLATTTGDFSGYNVSQFDSLRYIREAGFRYADYNFHLDYLRGDGVYLKDFEHYFAAIREHSEKIGIKLVQAHAPMGDPIGSEQCLDNSHFIRDTLRCVDAAGAFGVENLVIHSGYRMGISKEECFRENREFFLKILERAERFGLNILVENFNKMCIDGVFWIDNAQDLFDFIEYVDHPLLHGVWDVGHANLQSMAQEDEIRILGSHLKALHIQDNDGAKDDHLTPFLGTLDLDSVMRGLAEVGYDGYFTFEVGRVFRKRDENKDLSQTSPLRSAPLQLKRAYEGYLYELGKCILEAYGKFEC